MFSGFVGVLKRYWLPILLLVVVATVFAGGIIVTAYNKVRSATGGVLPAPKVS